MTKQNNNQKNKVAHDFVFMFHAAAYTFSYCSKYGTGKPERASVLREKKKKKHSMIESV